MHVFAEQNDFGIIIMFYNNKQVLMENIENIIFIAECLVSLAIIVGFVYSATKNSKIKGFLISTSILLVSFLFFGSIEWIFNIQGNNPILFYAFLIIFVLFLIWLTVDGLIHNLTSGDEIKSVFIKDTVKKLTILGFSAIGAILILELGMQIVYHKSFILTFFS